MNFLFTLLCCIVGVLGQKDHDIPCEVKSKEVCEEAEGCLWKDTTCAQIQLKKSNYNQFPQQGQTGQYNSRTSNQQTGYNSRTGNQPMGQYNSRTGNQPMGQFNSRTGNQPMGQYNSRTGNQPMGQYNGNSYGQGAQMQNGMYPQGQPGQHGAMPGGIPMPGGVPGQTGPKNDCGCPNIFNMMDPQTRSFTQYRQPRCQDCSTILGPPGMQTAQMCNNQYWIRAGSCEISLCIWEVDECEDASAHDKFECVEITSPNECPLVPGCHWTGQMCARAGGMPGQMPGMPGQMPGQMTPGQFPPHHYNALQKAKPGDKNAPVSVTVWSWSALAAFLVGVVVGSLLYLSYRMCKKANTVMLEPLHFAEI